MVNWDDSLDKRLLLTIIHVAAPAAVDYKKVAALMGSEFTASSIQYVSTLHSPPYHV